MVRQGPLKMVSADNKTCPSSNQYVIQYAQCGRGEVVPVHAIEASMESRGIAPLHLNLGPRSR
jgi:hypothetical protein